MYGIEVWYIITTHHGQQYYFKGIDRKQRLWTRKQPDSMFYCSKAEALQVWNDLGKIGTVEGGEYI